LISFLANYRKNKVSLFFEITGWFIRVSFQSGQQRLFILKLSRIYRDCVNAHWHASDTLTVFYCKIGDFKIAGCVYLPSLLQGIFGDFLNYALKTT